MSPRPIPETEGPLFHPPALRKRVTRFMIQEHVYLQAYWKAFGQGKGPAAILYLFGIETLKFDLYGRGKGHYHVNPNNPETGGANIVWMPEPDAAAQVERTLFELDRNLYFYLQRNVDARIRDLAINRDRLVEGLAWLKTQFDDMLENVPELKGL